MPSGTKLFQTVVNTLIDMGIIKPGVDYAQRVHDRVTLEENIKDLRAQREAARQRIFNVGAAEQISPTIAKMITGGESEICENSQKISGSFESRALIGAAEEIINEQFTRESIAIESLHHISVDKNKFNDELNSDFIRTILDSAKQIPDIQEIRTLWAKILAEGYSNKTAFSVRTLEILKTLSAYEIKVFDSICQFNIENGIVDLSGTRVIAGFPFDELKKYGLNSADVSILQDARLIDKPSPFINKVYKALPSGGILNIFGKQYLYKGIQDFNLLFLPFTEAGMQLAQVVATPPNKLYLADFLALLEKKGGKLLPITTSSA
jgi:hypothetical protein